MNAPAAPLPPPANPKLRRMANALRALAMDAVEQAKSGHPGMPMGMADIAAVLFAQFLRFDPQMPDWPDRDRFILSNGHGSMLLYGLLHLTGYPDMTMDEIRRFRQIGSRTAGHPERGLASGIEVTTGPLGQGLGNSVGMALAERHLAAEFGDDLVEHRTYVFCGDGCLMEGISHEALSLAGHLRLNKLIVFWDDNSISIDGPTDLAVSDDQIMRFRAHGWTAERIDGMDHNAIAAAIRRAHSSDRPSLIACRTVIAYGAPTKAGTAAAHGNPLGAEEVKGARERLGWEYPPFVIPDDIRAEWREAGARGAAVRQQWEQRLAAAPAEKRSEFLRRYKSELPADFDSAIAKVCDEFRAKNAKIATRQASGAVLDALVPVVPELIGGSADLTPSNNTKAKGEEDIKPGNYAGRYVRYGVREHEMAAAMNGMAAHGGLTLLATGSEVGLAMTARDMLANDGIAAAVVSMPCWELFEQQPADYQAAVLGTAPRIGVEAAVRFGWDRWLGPRGAFVGMHDFGASAPGEDVYKHFGITAEKVAAAARALL